MSGILAYTTFFAAGLLGLGGVRVPYTLLQPENSVTEQTAGSFQLAGAVYGIQKMGAKAYGLWTSPRGLLEGDHAHLTITGPDGDTNYSSTTGNAGFGPFKPTLNLEGQGSTISAIVWPTLLGMAFVLVLGILIKIGHWVYILVKDLEGEFKHWRWTVKNATLDNYSRQRKIQETLDKHGRQLSNIYVLSSVFGMGMEQIQGNINEIKRDMPYKLGRLQYSANCAEDELKYIHDAVDTLTNPAGDQDSQPAELELAPKPEIREEQTNDLVVASEKMIPDSQTSNEDSQPAELELAPKPEMAPNPEMREEQTNDLLVVSEKVIPDPQTSNEDSASEQTEQPEIPTEEPSSADQSPSSSEGIYDSALSSRSSPPSQPEMREEQTNDPVVASEEVIPEPQTSNEDSASEQTQQPEIPTEEPSSADQSPSGSEGMYDSAYSSRCSPPSQPEEANVEDREPQDASRNPDDQPQESLD